VSSSNANQQSLTVEPLLAKHLAALRAYVRLRSGAQVRNRESASDLAQSICVEVLRGQDRFEFENEAQFRGLLYQIADRKLIDRARYWLAECRNPGRESPPLRDDAAAIDEELMRTYGTVWTPSREAMSVEEIQRIERTMDRMPEHYRRVILMARFEHLDHAALAARLGKTEGAIRTMLCRALAHFSELLTK